MRRLPSILSHFRNEFNKLNNTRARMLDTIKITLKSHFCRENVLILPLRNVVMDEICSALLFLLHGVISPPRCDVM